MQKTRESPVAVNDFYKTNGMVHKPFVCEGASMTRQEFADECDINVLMRRYENQDIGSIMRQSVEPMYVDFSRMPSDLMGTLAFMEASTEAFMTLPASVRREFDNDAHRFVEYAVDPANVEQMRTWGLAKPLPPPPPVAAPAAASSASGGVTGEPPPSPAPSPSRRSTTPDPF